MLNKPLCLYIFDHLQHLGPFLLDLKYSRLKVLSLPLFCSNNRGESEPPVQKWEMYQFNLAKDLKEHKKSFPLNLKFTTDLNCLTTTCQQKASCPASCQLDGWALRLMTTEFAYIETPLYHLKNAIGHDYSIWMDYKLPEYWTYSSWCFFRVLLLSRK